MEKPQLVRQALIRILALLVACVLAAVVAITAYGHLFRTQVLENALTVALPAGGEIMDYHYFTGVFSASVVYPAGRYEEIKQTLEQGDICHVRGFEELHPEWARRLDILRIDGKELCKAEDLTTIIPAREVYVALLQTDEETVLYIAWPEARVLERMLP